MMPVHSGCGSSASSWSELPRARSPNEDVMINYVMVGTNRFEQALAFYDELMSAMGASKVYATDRSAGWGWGIGTPMFIVNRPYDQRPATLGNGSMVAFDVASAQDVDTLHARVLALGGSSEGDPGPRGEQIYAGYWR